MTSPSTAAAQWAEDKSCYLLIFHLVDLGIIPGTRMVGPKAAGPSTTQRLTQQRSGVSSVMVNPPFYQVRGDLGRGLIAPKSKSYPIKWKGMVAEAGEPMGANKNNKSSSPHMRLFCFFVSKTIVY